MRIVAALGLAITFSSLWASAASAHVTVSPNTAEQGARGRFVFRVPNESNTASTIKLAVEVPDGTKVAAAGLRTQPKQGWTVEVEKAKLDPPIKGETSDITEYVSKVTWTAQEGYKIGPNEFEEFSFTTGPLPKDKTSIAFKAVQYYDGPLADGTQEARWTEERREGQAEPRRPEPVVKLTAPTTPGGAATATNASASAADTAAADAKSAADSARNFGIIALVVAILALIAGLVAFLAKPKAAATRAAAPATSDETVDA